MSVGRRNRRGRLRVGVIGAGSMGTNHARVFATAPEVRLTAIADVNLDAARRVGDLYGARPYSDYAEMLDRERLDAVSVVVPTRLHAEVAGRVIEHGVSLLVEKPLASSIDECGIIAARARDAGVTLGVGHVERFNPVVVELKRLLDGEALGRVFQITIRRVGPFPARVQDVGVFLDLATHDIDIMCYLTGAEVLRVSAESARMLHEHHEDLAVAMLRFSNGIIGALVENWLSPVKLREVTVNGDRGMLVADLITQDLYFYENNYTTVDWDSLQVLRGVAEGRMVRYHLQRDEPLRLELTHFVDCVIRNEPFPVSGEDGVRAVRIAHLLGQAASSWTPFEAKDGRNRAEGSIL